MTFRTQILILGLSVLGLFPSMVFARDLQGRVGLGYNSQFGSTSSRSEGIPSISLKYAWIRDISSQLVLGISTIKPNSTVTALKFMKNLFLETNLNFYFFIGGGIVSGNNRTGGEFQSGFGAEFFIPGVDSLGLSMETGGGFTNLSGTLAFKTVGVSFINAGMHFYF